MGSGLKLPDAAIDEEAKLTVDATWRAQPLALVLDVTGIEGLSADYKADWPLAFDPRSGVVAGMVAVWTIRLGSFLFTRIHTAGGTDVRFAKIKVNPPRFLVAWTLQAVWVVITASAALVIITTPVAPLASGVCVGDGGDRTCAQSRPG